MAGATPLLFNPHSGAGRGLVAAEQAQRLLGQAGVDCSPVPTSEPGGARALGRRLAEEGAPRILVLGGDGTLSEAADGVLSSGRKPVLGFLPAGRGNDFLREFGVASIEEAVRRIVAGATRRIDAGRFTYPQGTSHTINVFGTGYIAHAGDLANRKYRWLGHRAYTAAAIRELVRFQAPPTRLTLDERVLEDAFNLVAVCTTKHTGGAMRIAPSAEPDDGLFDVVALRKVNRLQLLNLLRKVFKGRHVGHPRVLYERARRVVIEPSRPSPLLVDGEIFGTTPVELEVLPGAVEILV